MEKGFMLTTIDNPFDPFNDFASWFEFDIEKEHNTCSRLARIVNIDSEMTQKEIDEEMDRAMDFIVTYDLEHKYVKIQEKDVENLKKQTATAQNA